MDDETRKVLDYDHSTTEPERESIVGGFILGWFIGSTLIGLVMVILSGGVGVLMSILLAATLISGLPVLLILCMCNRSCAIGKGMAFALAIFGAPLLGLGLLVAMFMSFRG